MIVYSNSFGQIYEGGNSDGFSSSCHSQLNNPALAIYAGGNGNNSSSDCDAQTDNIALAIYSGGNSDGHDGDCYSQADNIAMAIYSGGISDGFDMDCFAQADNNSLAIYSGGISDGFDMDCFTQADNNSLAIYSGGISDGFSYDCFTQANNPGFDIYAGGFGGGFKFFCLGTLNEVPLPVELIYFEGQCLNELVKLDWITASEINNDYFSVQYSDNGIDWEEIGTIDGVGNSSTSSSYTFDNIHAFSDVTYYRLKQVDFDGNFEISSAISVSCNNLNSDFNIIIYPNPNNGSFVIEGIADATEFVIYNAVGEKIIARKTSGTKTEVKLENLSRGVYFIHFETNEGSIVKKIILN